MPVLYWDILYLGSSWSALPHLRDGRLKALVVTSRQRAPQLPQVPTAAETLGEFEAVGWIGMVAPAGLTPSIVQRLNAETIAILGNAEMRERIESLGADPKTAAPDAFANYIRSEILKWSKVVRDAGIPMQ
jgi:tripartite-type tricarboxylate transporter receptor subunit TctC